jgi:hypothetical protein
VLWPFLLAHSFQGGAFVEVGDWGLRTGLELTAPIIWPGNNDEARPSQEVPRKLITLSTGLQDGAYAVTVRAMRALGSLSFLSLLGLILYFFCVCLWVVRCFYCCAASAFIT